MSVSQILTPSGVLVQDVLPIATIASVLAVPILQTGGAVAAPLTGTFNCPQTGLYYIQLYLAFAGAGAAIGTGSIGLTYTNSDGWGSMALPVAGLTTGGANNQLVIGNIPAGTQTFTFTPSTSMNLGATGELAIRVVKGVV